MEGDVGMRSRVSVGGIVVVDIVERGIRWNKRGLCDGVNGRFAGILTMSPGRLRYGE